MLLVVVLLLVLNSVLAAYYRQRTYPNTTVAGYAVGATAYSALPEKVAAAKMLSGRITFTRSDKKSDVALTALGVSVDDTELRHNAATTKAWLPMANLLFPHAVPLATTMNETQFAETFKKLADVFKHDPVNAKIAKDKDFTITPEQNGFVLDEPAFKKLLTAKLASGEKTMEVPVRIVRPTIIKAQLQKPLAVLKKQLTTDIAIIYEGQRKDVTKEDKLTWYVPQDSGYVLSAGAVKQYVQAIGGSFGIGVANADETATGVIKSLETNVKQDFTLTKLDPTKTFSYCVAAKGLEYTMPILQAKLAQTYADPRGWSLGGKTRFVEVATGCDFTVWISAASEMPSFGDICDSTWSCRVGPNVVINADRWNGASDSWNAAGLNLEDYRSMVINHETGHWFGFNHSNCPGAGQLAPVMQQQSISLQGCTFNPWPLPSELAALTRSLGL